MRRLSTIRRQSPGRNTTRYWGIALALLALSCGAAAQCVDFKAYTATVTGPEDPTNLWQFASTRYWDSVASGTVVTGGNHARLGYHAAGTFSWIEQICNPTFAGKTLVDVAEYTSDVNTVTQRAYVAVTSVLIAAGGPNDFTDQTMREVPVAAATQVAGTVTVTWTDLPTQTEIIGYRVVRSADGLASWTTVADVAVGAQTRNDTPGSGTWYYAVKVVYLGSPTAVVSPHGLSAQVVVP